ncbi:hypothetical protein BH09ACT9_BH09ACT9_00240 [soil metagenome]
MTELSSPGTRLFGYCNGYFGRDSYGEKIIIATGIWRGKVWIVADESGHVVTATDVPASLPNEWAEAES